MADGHFPDVELLRRELAALILEWAGKAVKDDPDGPMSTALTRAVGEAARSAVADQHQSLADEAADRIAEAIERRGQTAGVLVWRVRPWVLGVIALGAAALLALAFFLGLQTGRTEGALPATPASTSTPPIAPYVPPATEPAPTSAPRHVAAPEPQPTVHTQRAAPSAAAPAPRTPPRELGRPAPAGDGAASRSTQPVGAAASPPPSSPATTQP